MSLRYSCVLIRVVFIIGLTWQVAYGQTNISSNFGNLRDTASVYIREVTLQERGNDTTTNALKVNLLDLNVHSLKYNENSLSFSVNSHESEFSTTKLKYKLRGFDEHWREVTCTQFVTVYSSLRPGEYKFCVVKIDEGSQKMPIDSFAFTIEPPFWKTWYFYLGLTLLFLLIIYALIRYRDRRLLAITLELERKVHERTHELSEQSEALKRQSEDIHKAHDELNKKSVMLEQQNQALLKMNKEITHQHKEMEDQKNSLANLAWDLQEKNEEITEQRNKIERQKSEMTDSIKYAQRIQQAILPSSTQIGQIFSDSFILNIPKSIVSGDFFWATRVGNKRIIAVVDCTGHGVPGGFMSILGVLLLNEIIMVKGILDPAQVLNELRERVISVLHQKENNSETTDGMDLSLCIIDDDNTLTFAGGNSVISVFSHKKAGTHALRELRSDRMPVGHYSIMDPFVNQTIKVETGDKLYLYTDGITDQFGGEKNKKFQSVQLRIFLHEHYLLPMKEQGDALEKTFYEWKGDSFQVDDVLVVGVTI